MPNFEQKIESKIKNLITKVMKLESQGQSGSILTKEQNIKTPTYDAHIHIMDDV